MDESSHPAGRWLRNLLTLLLVGLAVDLAFSIRDAVARMPNVTGQAIEAPGGI